jgi:hypothetical protein
MLVVGGILLGIWLACIQLAYGMWSQKQLLEVREYLPFAAVLLGHFALGFWALRLTRLLSPASRRRAADGVLLGLALVGLPVCFLAFGTDMPWDRPWYAMVGVGYLLGFLGGYMGAKSAYRRHEDPGLRLDGEAGENI